MTATYSVEETIRTMFDRFYTEVKCHDTLELDLDLVALLEDLEEACVVEAMSEYTTDAEAHYDDGYDSGREAGYGEGREDGREEGYEEGYEQAVTDLEKD